MIGYIIIGKNEGKKLVNCIMSIKRFNAVNGIKQHKIVYVDSNSTDNSLELVKQFPEMDVYQIKGKTNAALGRNIGAGKIENAHILFFIDGDMEIYPDFYPKAFVSEEVLKYNFISGKWINYYYAQSGEFLNKEIYQPAKEDKFESTTGGLFIIKKQLWDEVGGLNTALKTGEDLDIGLRLTKKGIPLLRKADILANHHTVSYKDNRRMWRDLFSGKTTYSRGVLYRQHLFNRHVLPRIIKSDLSSILFLLVSTSSFIISNYYLFIFYYFFLVFGAFAKKMSDNFFMKILVFPVYLFLRDLYTIFSFFFFYPAQIEMPEVVKIQ